MVRVGDKKFIDQQESIKPASPVKKKPSEGVDSFVMVNAASLAKLASERLTVDPKINKDMLKSGWTVEKRHLLKGLVAYVLLNDPFFKKYPIISGETLELVCKFVVSGQDPKVSERFLRHLTVKS